MQSVNIITLQDVCYHLTDIVAVLLQCRIQHFQSVIVETTLGMLNHHMIAGICMGRLRLGTIGINPSVQLHTALVALLHHPSQRVPVRLGSLALPSRQIAAPRFQRTLVKRITFWANLEDDDVTTILLQLVQLVTQRLLHGFGAHAHKLPVHTLYPGSTKLTFRLCRQDHRQHQT